MKTAIVTGAGRGIGAAIARRAARDGWKVGVLDVDADAAVSVADSLPDAVPLTADIRDEGSVEAALDEFGETPDLLVNNAGVVRFGTLRDLALDDWKLTVDVNLTGTFVMARAVACRMIERGSGAIVNITSINGVAPGPNAGAYGATKSAVALLTQQMAIEWGPAGIRVNAVAPGLIDAGMSEAVLADSEVRRSRESKVPLGRLGVADDIAAAVMFLASSDASYITGNNVVVDGGIVVSIIGQLPRPRSVDGVGPTG